MTKASKGKAAQLCWHTTSEFALLGGLTLVITDHGPGHWEWCVTRKQFLASGECATQDEARRAAVSAARRALRAAARKPNDPTPSAAQVAA